MQQTTETHKNTLLSKAKPHNRYDMIDMGSPSCERKLASKRKMQEKIEPPAKRVKRVKQVRFAEITKSPEKSKLTTEEKQERWILPGEKLKMRQSLVAEAQQLIALDNQAIECGQGAFCEAYARIYGVCLRDSADAAIKEPTFSFDDLSVFAYSDARGLEDCVVPSVGFERDMFGVTHSRRFSSPSSSTRRTQTKSDKLRKTHCRLSAAWRDGGCCRCCRCMMVHRS